MPQRIYAFIASRCFRKDSRRVISALAARTASALVDRCFGSGVLFTPTAGSVGRTWVGNIERRSIGCVFIGPVAGLFLGILENAFQLCETFSALKITCVSVISWKWACGDLKPRQTPCHNSSILKGHATTSSGRERVINLREVRLIKGDGDFCAAWRCRCRGQRRTVFATGAGVTA